MTTIQQPAPPSTEPLVPAHPERIALRRHAPDFYRAMIALDDASDAGVDPNLAELVRLRSSQINGCAYCVDTHAQDARDKGEREHRLSAVVVWRETPFFTARERAALALAEGVTVLPVCGVPDAVYAEAQAQFSTAELAALIGLCVTINAWNRIGVTTRMSPAPRS